MAQQLLEMRGISKVFPGVIALDGVDFTVRRGEIHALMGENGAGKSTLVKALTGVHRRDGGTVQLDGVNIFPSSPKEAEAVGISTVFQEVNLIPHLSVAENICLGREPTLLGMIRWGAVEKRAKAAMARLDLDIDVSKEVASCSIAIQQMVAIARALDVDAKMLILDEPTSSLDAHEVEELFKSMRKLRSQGLGIVFITHFMDQVYAVSDQITVLRDGKLVGEYPAAKLSRMELVSRMIGRPYVPPDHSHAKADPAKRPAPDAANSAAPIVDYNSPESKAGDSIEIRGLAKKGSIEPITFNIKKGEIVGLAGLLGSGRTETARLIFGIDRSESGSINVFGNQQNINSPRAAIRLRFAFTPENRKVEGIIPRLSVRENMILSLQASRGIFRPVSRREQLEIADRYIKAMGIKTPGPEQRIMNLSGGNQQKVLLGRWLANNPALFILDEPTRGIDVGAKAEIEKLMVSLCAEGMAILFISSELEEIVHSCDRVVVLRDRHKVGELEGANIQMDNLMQMIAKDGND